VGLRRHRPIAGPEQDRYARQLLSADDRSRVFPGRSPNVGSLAGPLPEDLPRWPLVTIVLVSLTAATNLAQLLEPGLLTRLERTPAELHGQWWRIVASLFVQDGGPLGTVSNLAFLLVLGIAAERVLPRPRLLAQYFGVGMVSELVGYLWQPVGGGNSVAICGLAGTVALALWNRDDRLPVFSDSATVMWCAALLGTLSTRAYLPAIVAGVAAVGLMGRIRSRGLRTERPAAVVIVLTMLVLVSSQNLHGGALALGLAVALVTTPRHTFSASHAPGRGAPRRPRRCRALPRRLVSMTPPAQGIHQLDDALRPSDIGEMADVYTARLGHRHVAPPDGVCAPPACKDKQLADQGVPMSRATERQIDRPTVRTARRTALELAGLLYPASWIVGLSVFTASATVNSSGTAILHADRGHGAALVAQFFLTEGVPGVLLGIVIWRLAKITDPPAGVLIAAGGLGAAAISTVQCWVGFAITAAVTREDTRDVGSWSRLLERMDGVKMLLLAVVGVVTALAIRRAALSLPGWLGGIAAGTAVTIAVSGVGYVFLDNTLAAAAWVSLPLLLCFITASALVTARTNATSSRQFATQ
jgi:membrane associated rhomboid family serine protease